MALTNVDLDRIDGNSGTLANVNTSSINGGPISGARNRIINGDMRIDQRNAGASVTLGIGSYSVDRWETTENTDGGATGEQVQDAPAGFTDSLKWTTTTADASLSANQYCRAGQIIEGFNTADFEWGSASAKTVTLSFWVRSSLTGTFAGGIRNSAGDRSYVFTYTISSADTWENKTITIEGDTSGTWLTDNGRGVWLIFDLGSGSDFQKTPGAWGSGDCWSTSSAVSVIGTLNATWYITGVQLEIGTIATPFERRSYGQELALCQRYYQEVSFSGVVFNGNSSSSAAGPTQAAFVPTRTTTATVTSKAGNATLYHSAGRFEGNPANNTASTITNGGINAGRAIIQIARLAATTTFNPQTVGGGSNDSTFVFDAEL